MDRIGQGDSGLLHGGLLDEFKIAVFRCGLGGFCRRQAGDCENGALCGLHHRFVGGVDALLQGPGPEDAVAFPRAF